MASQAELRKDFLTCMICYDVYTTPKSLPCLHTFCRRCLSSYIVAEDETFGVRRKKAFPCPVCRALTRPSAPLKPLKQWANDFKTNFYIENLMTALRVKDEQAEQTTQTSNKDNTNSDDKGPTDASNSSSRLSRQSGFLRSVDDVTSLLNPVSDEPTSHSSMPDLNVNSRDNVHITNLSVPLCRKSYQLIKSLPARMPDDNREARLLGICVVDDTIVILDYENRRIKSFFDWNVRMNENIVTRSLKLPRTPRSITEIQGFAVAVTVPAQRAIHMVKVKPILETVSIANTARRYKSVADSGSGSLVAVASKSGSTISRLSPIDILNYEGDALKSIDISYELRGLDFDYISVSNSGLVHLVDSAHNGIYCVTQDGVELYRYTQNNEREQFKALKGICCRSNDIYLTDIESDSVFEVSCDCSLPASREKILSGQHGISKPRDVYVDRNGTIFVACWDGFVRVYSLKPESSAEKKSVETVV